MDEQANKYIVMGMYPNRMIDAWAFSAGAKAIYDYKLSIYKKQGLSQTESHERALRLPARKPSGR